MWKKFKVRKLSSIKNISSLKQVFTSALFLKIVVIAASLVLIVMVWQWAWSFAQSAWKSAAQFATNVASKQIWTPLETDEYWNINILVSWYAWDWERWAYLTDAILLASYNPRKEVVTFLSIPRDLYVNYNNGRSGKINGLYRSAYLSYDPDDDTRRSAESEGDDNDETVDNDETTTDDETDDNTETDSVDPAWSDIASGTLSEEEIRNRRHQAWGARLAEKVSEITGVDIPYFAVISFDGFVEFIDEIGWVDIDVPYSLYDNEYPGPNDSYTVFQVDQWRNNFDWERALKYARSRKSTSDFSRALRQQQIIEAVLTRITAFENVRNIMSIYDSLENAVKTNMQPKQLLWSLQYLEEDRHYFSFVYTAECNKSVPDLAEPWCLLYYGDRSAFWWMSVLLPEGARPSNISYYNKLQDFAFRVVHNQWYLKERAEIRVLNGIDLPAARAQWYNINGVATTLALDLIERGFQIDRITNTDEPSPTTKIVIPGDWRYPNTVNTLWAFVDYSEIVVDPAFGSWVSIILWDEYLSNL